MDRSSVGFNASPVTCHYWADVVQAAAKQYNAIFSFGGVPVLGTTTGASATVLILLPF